MNKRIPIADKLDVRKAIVASILFMITLLIVLWVLKYEMADPPPKDYILPAQMDLEVINLKEFQVQKGGGAGRPSDAKVDPNPPKTVEQVLTNPKSSRTTNSGKGKITNTNKSDAEATSPVKSDNPFGQQGRGETDGPGKGKKGLGPDTGPGEGEGGTDTKPRIRLNDPNSDDIYTNVNVTVRVKVTINANGDVVKAMNISSVTTTTDQRLINQVLELVKQQAKYNKKPNAALEEAYITVKLGPR